MRKLFIMYLLLFACIPFAVAGEIKEEKIVYKTVNDTKLSLYVTSPENIKPNDKFPAVVYFNGGAWKNRSMTQFETHAEYLAKRGVVCVRAEYRVESIDKSTPFQSLEDARSAMRYVRGNASDLGIDPNRIAASGGSAGGHLAAACALVDGWDSKGDDMSISCKPNALILFNPVVDNSPAGYGYSRVAEHYKEFSPLHNLKEGVPPVIFFLGTKDKLIPVETAEYFKKCIERLGGECELHLYEGEEHSFFNKDEFKPIMHELSEKFLHKIGWIGKELDTESLDKIKTDGVNVLNESIKSCMKEIIPLESFNQIKTLTDNIWFYTDYSAMKGDYKFNVGKEQNEIFVKSFVKSTYQNKRQKRTDWNRCVIGYHNELPILNGIYKVSMKIKTNKVDNNGDKGKASVVVTVRSKDNSSSYALANVLRGKPGTFKGTRLGLSPKESNKWETVSFYIDFGNLFYGKPLSAKPGNKDFSVASNEVVEAFTLLMFNGDSASAKTISQGVDCVESTVAIKNIVFEPFAI